MHKSHAPAINPYDKLTQNQFDSYVSNIQAKIQLALNPPSPEPRHVSRSIAEISQSTIASPAPSLAPLSKRSSLEPRVPPKSYSPLGAGTPNEPYELSDDDEESEEPVRQARPPVSSSSEADAESDAEREPVPLSAIPEGIEGGEEADEETRTDEAYYSGYENGDEPQEEEWYYSGEDASEEAEEEAEEEEDVFVGKGKGRHPAEGPGLSGLLHGSGALSRGPASTFKRGARSSRAIDDSFEAGVGRMPALGTTSTPFISRLRSRSARSQDSSDEEDAGSPPWEDSQGISMPAIATYQEGESEEESAEESEAANNGPGGAREDAIEVLDSDEEEGESATPKRTEADKIAPYSAPTDRSGRFHDNTEFDELQFDDSATYPDEGQEPDSLLDDTMDADDSMRLRVLTDDMPPGPSSLFSASSIAITREPSQSKDGEEIDHSADTVHAREHGVEDLDPNTAIAGSEREFDQSIQRSLDYSDFIGERSLLAQQDTSITQAEQQLHEVTVYELENGSRYYDFDGVRHFLNPEGEVYETAAIPPPRPTIQQPPDLSMIEEVTEYDITRRMVGAEDEEGGYNEGNFDFLKELDSIGERANRYYDGDDSTQLGIDDIPQRPGAALGFRSRGPLDADSSAFLSESVVVGDHVAEHDTSRHRTISNWLGPTSSFMSATGTVEESMTGRNANDLVSEDDIVSASEAGGDGDGDGDESHDSILDDDGDTTRDLDSRVLDRDDLITPVPRRADESGMESQFHLDEKGVTDALAAVAQLAEETSFEEFMAAGPAEGPVANDPMFDSATDLENLLNEVSSMSAEEEEMLARSFNMTDALRSTSIPLDELSNFGHSPAQPLETTIESSILDDFNSAPLITVESAPEKLASEVLAEVFEGVEPISVSSVTGTGTATPSGGIETSPQIEVIEVLSRSPTPQQSLPRIEHVDQDPSPRRTPTTPTLSAGRSLTAPEFSIATSVSEPSVVQPNVSVYEGSPSSSVHQDYLSQVVLPAQSDTTELPDPNLPPSPTHLSMPTVPIAPNDGEVQGEASASVVVEPPTPQATSEDGGVEANTISKPVEILGSAETPPLLTPDEGVANEVEPVNAEKEHQGEKNTPPPLSQATSTPSRRPRTRSPSAYNSNRESIESRATPSPDEKTRAGEKRKRLEDPPSPTSTALRLSVKSPARRKDEAKSPSSGTSPPPDTPTPRQNRSLFKLTPNSKPPAGASGTTLGKTSGSDSAPAPWPLRNRTHRHQQPATSPGRSNGNRSTGSPVPRSNCRYHKVVVQADDESRMEFIIPACALERPGVLKENNVEDHGLSTAEEEATMTTDFSDIEPKTIDKLRALVGISLFDEGVCGYIPKSTAKASRPAPNRLTGSLRGSISESIFEPLSENESKTDSAQVKPKPHSRPSIPHEYRLYKPLIDKDSAGSTEEEPIRKRLKHKKRDTIGSMSSVKFPSLGQDSPQKPTPTQPEGRGLISRRMKRARKPADAQLYRPDVHQGESSPEDESKGNPRKRTKHQATAGIRRMNSRASTQDTKESQSEDENPFKPKHELNRILSPGPMGDETREQSQPSGVDLKPSPDEQKDLERHIELGDHPGEVVTEEGELVDAKKLPEPAPAKAAIHVDRNAPSDIGKKESNSAGENALGTQDNAKKGWSKFLRF